MPDNSNNRKKALAVSVLAFLFIGGGVFLFFIMQGANDLTGKGKNRFSYGEAAREGVSSFFKTLGVVPEEAPNLSEAAVDRLKTRGIPLDELGVKDSDPNMSDWMASNSAGGPSSSGSSGMRATTVPKMSGGGGSPVGGSGGGGTKSSGGVSRFGEGNTAGNVNVSAKAQSGAGGPAGKGTMATLKNARALLGDGLKSDSAMTARSKWGQSFGVGGSGGKSGDLAYNKTGLVNLDKIKNGEIASLKMDNKSSLKTTDVSSPVKDAEGTKAALSGDKKVKEDVEAKIKADAIKAAADAAMQNATNSAKPAGPNNTPSDPNKPPEAVLNSMDANEYKNDTSRTVTRNSDGTWTAEYKGEDLNAEGKPIAYSDKVTYNSQGIPIDLVVTETLK